MTGYTVHTGASKKFVSGWDRVFGDDSSSGGKAATRGSRKSAGDGAAKSAAAKAAKAAKILINPTARRQTSGDVPTYPLGIELLIVCKTDTGRTGAAQVPRPVRRRSPSCPGLLRHCCSRSLQPPNSCWILPFRRTARCAVMCWLSPHRRPCVTVCSAAEDWRNRRGTAVSGVQPLSARGLPRSEAAFTVAAGLCGFVRLCASGCTMMTCDEHCSPPNGPFPRCRCSRWHDCWHTAVHRSCSAAGGSSYSDPAALETAAAAAL